MGRRPFNEVRFQVTVPGVWPEASARRKSKIQLPPARMSVMTVLPGPGVRAILATQEYLVEGTIACGEHGLLEVFQQRNQDHRPSNRRLPGRSADADSRYVV